MIRNEPTSRSIRPGNTEAERMDNAVRKMFTVSKEGILKRQAEWKKAQAKKKMPKKQD